MDIAEWEWDDGNLDELAAHGITDETVEQVAEIQPGFRKNKRNRAATHAMVGPDRGGTLWVICIVENPSRSGIWRAVTGWRADGYWPEWYRRSK